MVVEDHPKYQTWSDAFDLRNESERRYREARMRQDKAVDTFRLDFERAQTTYDKICEELD
jgi:hypothetical protein